MEGCDEHRRECLRLGRRARGDGGGKWKPLILYHLRSGPKRFGDLKRRVTGISEKVLIQQLRELVGTDVLTRRDYQQVPPKVEYTITSFGMTLVQALLPLCDWGTKHRTKVEALASARSLMLQDAAA